MKLLCLELASLGTSTRHYGPLVRSSARSGSPESALEVREGLTVSERLRAEGS